MPQITPKARDSASVSSRDLIRNRTPSGASTENPAPGARVVLVPGRALDEVDGLDPAEYAGWPADPQQLPVGVADGHDAVTVHRRAAEDVVEKWEDPGQRMSRAVVDQVRGVEHHRSKVGVGIDPAADERIHDSATTVRTWVDVRPDSRNAACASRRSSSGRSTNATPQSISTAPVGQELRRSGSCSLVPILSIAYDTRSISYEFRIGSEQE
jgi:hypothetical protein